MTSWLADDGVVALRPLTTHDTEIHVAGIDEALLRSIGAYVRPSRSEVTAWLADNARAWAEADPVVDLGLVDLSTGALAGIVGFQRGLDYLALGQVNLTYTLYADARGRGLATRGVELVTAVAQAQEPVGEFVIRAAAWNRSSIAVAHRLGFIASHVTDDEHGRLEWFVRPST